MKLKSRRRTKMLKAAEPKRIPQFFFTAPMHPTSDAKLIMRENEVPTIKVVARNTSFKTWIQGTNKHIP